MARQPRLLSRPLYEGLPWLYVVAGLGGLILSYLLVPHGALSIAAGAFGLVALLAGIVVLLRRRDYREMRTHYDPEALGRKDS
jgi:O-antigen/teichoic acid export membrane protein